MAQITKKLDIIVAAAEKYLVLQEFTAEDIQGVLAMEDVPHFLCVFVGSLYGYFPQPKNVPIFGIFLFSSRTLGGSNTHFWVYSANKP